MLLPQEISTEAQFCGTEPTLLCPAGVWVAQDVALADTQGATAAMVYPRGGPVLLWLKVHFVDLTDTNPFCKTVG